MMKITKSVLAVAALGLSVSACSSGNGTVRLTPQPASPTSYTQIERLSRPAVKEVFERFVDHQVSNAAEPYNDPTLSSAIPAVTQALGRSAATANFLGKVLYPDEYTVDLSQTGGAAYLGNETGGFTSATKSTFGGRDINDDVIDISLGAIFGNVATNFGVPDDNAENNCLTNQHVSPTATTNKTTQSKIATFPYLNVPH